MRGCHPIGARGLSVPVVQPLFFLGRLGIEGGEQGFAVVAGIALAGSDGDRPPRMGGAVDLLEHADADLGVDLGGG